MADRPVKDRGEGGSFTYVVFSVGSGCVFFATESWWIAAAVHFIGVAFAMEIQRKSNQIMDAIEDRKP
jgi:hypothetical protein